MTTFITILKTIQTMIKSGIPWYVWLFIFVIASVFSIPAIISFYTAYKIKNAPCMNSKMSCADAVMTSDIFISINKIAPAISEMQRDVNICKDKLKEMRNDNNSFNSHVQDLALLMARLQGSLDTILSQGGRK